MTDVTILLSTWNGARFLPAQLASFATQTHRARRLRWRDDASTDGTRALLEATDGAPLADDGVRRGITDSFTALLRAHVADGAPGHVAFSDQDDIWLPEKLARGVAALDGVPASRPALYCAPQMLVDAGLHTIGPSPPLRRPPGFPDALAQNVATGCTVMANEAACRLVAGMPPPGGTLHDWWAYLVVSAAGGAVLVDRVPTVLYRQHDRNAIGSPRSRLRRAGGAMRRGPDAFMSTLRAHVRALSAHADRLAPASRALLTELEPVLDAGPLARARLLRRLRIARQTAAETALFRLWFVLG